MKKLTLVLVAFGIAGCVMDPAYVEADRLTYEAVAPVYSAATNDDPTLTNVQQAARFEVLRSWKARWKEHQ